jgi:hypothetical protein
MEVSDTTFDIAIYLHERGWVFPQNLRPDEPILLGIKRPIGDGRADLRPKQPAKPGGQRG